MPDVGEGLTEAEVVTWNVAAGDVVTVNQILCEIETAKAAVELPSPYAGTVGQLLVEPGQTVAVGSPIISIETGEAAPAAAPSPAPAAADEEQGAKIGEPGKDGRIANLVGYGPRPGASTRRPRRGAPAAAPTPAAAAAAPAAPTPAPAAELQESHVHATGLHERGFPATGAGGAATGGASTGGAATGGAGAGTGGAANGSAVPLAKPPVRKLARDLGVDLRTVTPTGPGGVITREDVQAHVAAPAAPAPATAPAASTGGVRREPIRGVRKHTAAAMVSSAFTAPHVTEFLAVDVTATMALRDRLRATREYAEVKLTPLAFVAKAVCLAARRTPEINASWDEAAGEIVYYDRVQLGIAAATPRGLIVPKVRDADTLTLHGLAQALGELTATARSGKTPPADLANGTFTITNVGVFGVDTGTPILNPGEAGILAVGAIKPTPWVVDGELAVRTVCQLALSFDHRLVDGEQGSRFLADVGALLTDPALALTW
ncbi:dihydrolipoamide acetyltransferase family protein [Pseudonocardia broussonetiae]|uniref:Dihydrolipoamide acetyltransferase component of pyruvate dehydrogenase complex n=1 Tax=Pseudonocardia broussonetiae TaxID=2736640 RepID=A0A6M6JTD7_9PSEU|nr:dihydrolipoamide acetyltransferase family protein [Pseudonocardia broussonetiae]QJY50503.1 2-oxo acid dehydrogenase subunit E2 [Pseudonocardia broussonetiae]